MNFIEARDILYQAVCDAVQNYDRESASGFKQDAHKLASEETLETLIVLLESELPCSKFKSLEPAIEFIRSYWKHPIHDKLGLLRKLSEDQKQYLAHHIGENDLSNILERTRYYPLETLDYITETIDKDAIENTTLEGVNSTINLNNSDIIYYIGLLAYDLSVTTTVIDKRWKLMMILSRGLFKSLLDYWLEDNKHLLLDPQTRVIWFDRCPFVKPHSIVTAGTPYWVIQVLEATNLVKL